VARLAAGRGEPATAARLYGAAEALSEAVGAPQVMPPPTQYPRHIAELRTALDAAAFAAAWAAGRALPLDEAMDEARAVTAAAAPDPMAAGRSGSPAALTRREREILRLVADGQTDREIAATLFISERTVEWHLKNAFEKLGAATRAAAIAAAVRDGLI
jgi:DNA-binding CsgD family transcriptional regulator